MLKKIDVFVAISRAAACSQLLLNYCCGHWTTGVVIELLCGHWTDCIFRTIHTKHTNKKYCLQYSLNRCVRSLCTDPPSRPLSGKIGEGEFSLLLHSHPGPRFNAGRGGSAYRLIFLLLQAYSRSRNNGETQWHPCLLIDKASSYMIKLMGSCLRSERWKR